VKKSCKIVISGKGGTGKTTVSALLVSALANTGKNPVLAVDADSNANLNEALGVDLQETFGSMREEAFTKNIPQGMNRTEYIKYRFFKVLVESEGFDLLTMGRPEGSGCYCFPNSLLSECISLLERDYPFIIIDSEAGMEHISRGTIRSPDILLIVSDPGVRGIRTARRIRELAISLGMENVPMFLVFNRYTSETALETAHLTDSLPLIMSIPEDPEVLKADLEATPIVGIPEQSPARVAVECLAEIIIKQCAMQ
jgi:CO dehydrogenase maturation factor